jgi:dCMP deaminase
MTTEPTRATPSPPPVVHVRGRQELRDGVWLRVATAIAELGTCARRKVGCVLVDARGHVLSTGYNGPAAGEPHCIDQACPGAGLASGTGLEACEALHAEQNALLQCSDVWRIHTVYCTDSPCITCVKLLLNTSAQRICFVRAYPHSASEALWTRSGRSWEQHTGD